MSALDIALSIAVFIAFYGAMFGMFCRIRKLEQQQTTPHELTATKAAESIDQASMLVSGLRARLLADGFTPDAADAIVVEILRANHADKR